MIASGFTLVELLVSISIISVLMSVLFPVLGVVIESGRNVVCLSNLHTYGQLISMYREDHGGVLPFSRHVFNDVVVSRTGFIDSVVPYMDGVNPPHTSADGAMITYYPFRCPSDPSLSQISGMSYAYAPAAFMNISLSPSDREIDARAKEVTIMLDERTVILADGDHWHANGDRNSLIMDGSVKRLHDRRAY